jgi:hypothetical protein
MITIINQIQFKVRSALSLFSLQRSSTSFLLQSLFTFDFSSEILVSLLSFLLNKHQQRDFSLFYHILSSREYPFLPHFVFHLSFKKRCNELSEFVQLHNFQCQPKNRPISCPRGSHLENCISGDLMYR